MRLRQLGIALLALSLASPAWASKIWVKAINNESKIAFARPHLIYDATYGVYDLNQTATSMTNVIGRVQSDYTVTQISGPPSLQAASPARGIGIGADGLFYLSTGGSGGEALASASPPTMSSWTELDDNLANTAYGGTHSAFGASAILQETHPSATVAMKAFLLSPASNVTNAAAGYTLYESSACTVFTTGSSYAIFAAINSGNLHTIGIDLSGGNAHKIWQPSDGAIGSFSNGSLTTLRTCMTDGTRGVIFGYTGSNTVIAMQDSAGTKNATNGQVITSLDVRPAFYGNLDGSSALWGMTTGGVAYKESGGTFSDATGTTYDITLDGGDAVAGGVMAWSPLIFTTAGDVWEWKTPSAPTVTLTGALSSANSDIAMTWTASYADSCTATGKWSGSKTATGGTETVSPKLNGAYTLTCTNELGSTVATFTVPVPGGGSKPPSLSGSL